MAENSKIEWCGPTWNPWRGCTHATLSDGSEHPGCAHCYAETMARRNPAVLGRWGKRGTRILAVERQWKAVERWNADAPTTGLMQRVFVDSMSDFYEDWPGRLNWSDGQEVRTDCEGWFGTVEEANTKPYRNWHKGANLADARSRAYDLIDACQNLFWLILTKRPGNVWRMWEPTEAKPLPERPVGLHESPHPLFRHNVALGTSISDQRTNDELYPQLAQLRNLVSVLFLSLEPLIEPVDIGLQSATCGCCPRWPSRWVRLPSDVHGDWPIGHTSVAKAGIYRARSNQHGALSLPDQHGRSLGIKPAEFESLPPVDWVIVGGESGPHARPCNVEWIRSIVEQCKAAGVAVFVKQLGSHAVDGQRRLNLQDKKGGDWNEWPEDLRVREFPQEFYRQGKESTCP